MGDDRMVAPTVAAMHLVREATDASTRNAP